MTEFEFEKAARGTTWTVNEYAWGSTSITAAKTISTTSPPENGTEIITADTNANCNYNWTTGTLPDFSGGDQGTGPLRCGIFAIANNTNRVSAGAGYYGVMELSGNLWEVVVPVGNSDGRNFDGSHGDGALDSDGCATNTGWPGTTAAKNSFVTGMKGGTWDLAAVFAQVSFRLLSESNAVYRSNAFGARLVRTAP
jgi:formylglycine-generating enzyme required for sulfatase activity